MNLNLGWLPCAKNVNYLNAFFGWNLKFMKISQWGPTTLIGAIFHYFSKNIFGIFSVHHFFKKNLQFFYYFVLRFIYIYPKVCHLIIFQIVHCVFLLFNYYFKTLVHNIKMFLCIFYSLD